MNDAIFETVNKSLSSLEKKINKLKALTEQSDDASIKQIADKAIEAMNMASGKLKAAAIDSNYSEDISGSISFLNEKTNSLYINALTKIKEEMAKSKTTPVTEAKKVEPLIQTTSNQQSKANKPIQNNVAEADDQLINKIRTTLQEWMSIGV